MKEKIKSFIKGHSFSSLWFLLYLIIQVIVSIGIMVIYVFKNKDYANLFLEVMGPIYQGDANTFNSFYYSEEMINAYNLLFSKILIPILLFSNLLIFLVFVIKILIKKEKAIQKLEINNICKYICIGIILNLVISLVISFCPKEWLEQHAYFTDSVLNGNFFIVLFTTGIISPIAEEIIFRYGIQRNLSRFNIVYAIIVQALIFGLLHGNTVQIIYASVLGLIFGIIYYKTNNLLPSILLHIAINSSSVIISYIKINEFISLLSLSIISFIIFIITNFIKNKKLI